MPIKNNEPKHFKDGERILSIGDTPTAAYLIMNGAVRVFLEEGTREVELASLGPNDIFGETAIFSENAHSANCNAVGDTTLLVITPETLNQMLHEADPILQNIVKMLIKRLQKTNEALLKSETREFMDVVLI